MYRIKWAKNENVDDRVLADWEHEIVTCIKNVVRGSILEYERNNFLKIANTLNILRISMNYNYVLVPADKAASNIIVVCKKYYLDVVVSELSLNMPSTYVEMNTTCGA